MRAWSTERLIPKKGPLAKGRPGFEIPARAGAAERCRFTHRERIQMCQCKPPGVRVLGDGHCTRRTTSLVARVYRIDVRCFPCKTTGTNVLWTSIYISDHLERPLHPPRSYSVPFPDAISIDAGCAHGPQIRLILVPPRKTSTPTRPNPRSQIRGEAGFRNDTVRATAEFSRRGGFVSVRVWDPRFLLCTWQEGVFHSRAR